MADKKVLYYLGRGTLGKKVKQGDPIPSGYLSEKRLEELKKKGLVGQKIEKIEPVKVSEQLAKISKELEKVKEERDVLSKELDDLKKGSKK